MIPHGSERHEIIYLLVHNKLPTKERLFWINLEENPYCGYCFENFGIAAVGDLVHTFCSCRKLTDLWKKVRENLQDILQLKKLPENDVDLISLQFLYRVKARDLVWLISTYVCEIWRFNQGSDRAHLCKEKFFGFLRFKYKRDYQKSLVGHIGGLSD